jgi:hypothetical protein
MRKMKQTMVFSRAATTAMMAEDGRADDTPASGLLRCVANLQVERSPPY